MILAWLPIVCYGDALVYYVLTVCHRKHSLNNCMLKDNLLVGSNSVNLKSSDALLSYIGSLS